MAKGELQEGEAARKVRGTQLLEKSIEVLMAFLPENRPMTVAEISRKVGHSRPTVHRILATLEEYKLLIRNEDDKRFQLGLLAMYLGDVARQGFDLGRWARPVLQGLAESSRETVHLAVQIAPAEGAFIEKVESHQSVRLHTVVGKPVPLYTGASFKVILAHLSPGEQEAVLSRAAGDGERAVDLEALRRELQAIRERGFAVSRGELYPGGAGVAVAVPKPDGRPLAGLGIAAPDYRLTEERIAELLPLLREAARRLSLSDLYNLPQ